MKLIKFNCILVLIWESCKIIHLGNTVHRSTAVFLSPASQPVTAPSQLQPWEPPFSRGKQQHSYLLSPHNLCCQATGNLSDSRDWIEVPLIKKSDNSGTHDLGMKWSVLIQPGANTWLLIALKKEALPALAVSQEKTPAKGILIHSNGAVSRR